MEMLLFKGASSEVYEVDIARGNPENSSPSTWFWESEVIPETIYQSMPENLSSRDQQFFKVNELGL
jgi:hypothetical protein